MEGKVDRTELWTVWDLTLFAPTFACRLRAGANCLHICTCACLACTFLACLLCVSSYTPTYPLLPSLPFTALLCMPSTPTCLYTVYPLLCLPTTTTHTNMCAKRLPFSSAPCLAVPPPTIQTPTLSLLPLLPTPSVCVCATFVSSQPAAFLCCCLPPRCSCPTYRTSPSHHILHLLTCTLLPAPAPTCHLPTTDSPLLFLSLSLPHYMFLLQA